MASHEYQIGGLHFIHTSNLESTIFHTILIGNDESSARFVSLKDPELSTGSCTFSKNPNPRTPSLFGHAQS